MKGDLKNKIISVLGLLTIILFIFSIRSCQDAAEQKKLVNRERRLRMELEERVLNLSNQNTDLEQKINQLQETFNQQKARYRTTSQALNQEISRLKGELEKLTKLKEKLEENLKEALISPGGDT